MLIHDPLSFDVWLRAWSVHWKGVRLSEVFGHRYLCDVARIGGDDRVDDAEVRNRVFSTVSENARPRTIEVSVLHWTGHVFPIPCFLFTYWIGRSHVDFNGWRNSGRRGHVQWTSSSLRSRNPSAIWLEILRDTAANRGLWFSCRHFLSSQNERKVCAFLQLDYSACWLLRYPFVSPSAFPFIHFIAWWKRQRSLRLALLFDAVSSVQLKEL